MPSQTVSLPAEEDVQAESPTLPMDLETDCGKERNPSQRDQPWQTLRWILEKLELLYLPDQFLIRSYQRSSKTDMSWLIRTINILLGFGRVIIELRDLIPVKSSLHYYSVQLRSLFQFILVVSKVIYVSLVCSILKKEGMWCIFSIAYMIYECTKVPGIDY